MNLDDIIGQSQVVDTIKIIVKSRKQQGKEFPHSIITGAPGHGKSTLAKCIANQFDGCRFTQIDATHIGTQVDKLAMQLIDWEDDSRYNIYFIDEVHALKRQIQESLYIAMEQGIIGVDPTPMGKFTLIAATTESVTKPLLDRFQHHFQLAHYGEKEIAKILSDLTTMVDVNYLAKFSRMNPRIAKNHLAWLQDYNVGHANVKFMCEKTVQAAMKQKGILVNGITQDDVDYLKFLHSQSVNGRTVGLENIAVGTGLSKKVITDVIEPFLIKLGYVSRLSRGRALNMRMSREWKELIK